MELFSLRARCHIQLTPRHAPFIISGMLRFIQVAALLIRFLLALVAAAALLYTFSYPHSLLPPNPVAEDVAGLHIYLIRPVLWLLPLVVLELICLAGPHRNRIWFGSTLTVLMAGLLAWPVLQAWRPELVYPMLEFEDARLAAGLGYMAILLAVSVVLRLVVLAHLFHSLDDWQGEGHVEATVLNPATARTVREIAADAPRVAPRFLFGEADQGVIERFRLLMGTLWRRALWQRCLLAAALLGGLAWFFLYPQPTEVEAMERDFAAMYETDTSGLRATPRAVHAAYRILKHVHTHESLAGMNNAEAEQWLRLGQASPAYRQQLRSSHHTLASIDTIFDTREPFLTITDGRRTAALFVRYDISGERINVAEVADAGWNAVADEYRRRFGDDWKVSY